MTIKKRKLSKRERRFLAVRAIVSTHRIRTQDELADELNKRGFETTQSSLSRDIKKIGLLKREGHYQVPLLTPNGMLVPPILEAHPTGHNLIVLKTLPSMAPTLGSTIDEMQIKGVLGSVAGDDTVFVATTHTAKIGTVVHRLLKIFSPQQPS